MNSKSRGPFRAGRDMVSQFPLPRIFNTYTAKPIVFSCNWFLTYSMNETYLWAKIPVSYNYFPTNKLCNAWPFRLNYSFFLSIFLMLILILFLILSMGSLSMHVSRCARDQWRTRVCIFPTTTVLLFIYVVLS